MAFETKAGANARRKTDSNIKNRTIESVSPIGLTSCTVTATGRRMFVGHRANRLVDSARLTRELRPHVPSLREVR